MRFAILTALVKSELPAGIAIALVALPLCVGLIVTFGAPAAAGAIAIAVAGVFFAAAASASRAASD